DKRAVFGEIRRVLRPGGDLQFADIANGRPVPPEALRDIDLWTGRIAGGPPCAGWAGILAAIGVGDISLGEPVATFGGLEGEEKARAYEVFGYSFLARNPH